MRRLIGALLFSAATLWAADNVKFYQIAPGEISIEKTPMFVAIGWDDNGYADAMNWFVDFSKSRNNPVGSGNPATFDGRQVTSTYFITGAYATEGGVPQPDHQTPTEVLESWKKAYAEGNEIGNHSWDHPHGRSLSLEQWRDEQIDKCSDFLAEQIGMPKSEIYGFRTPYLEYNGPTTLAAVKELGFVYDCSVEFGFNGWAPIEGDPDFPSSESGVWHNGMTTPATHGKLFWPYTLDEGAAPGNSAYGNVTLPGLWEFMVYTLLKKDNSAVLTGFDYNTWLNYNAADWLEMMKYNFDLRRAGNKSPFTLNCHTDYYSPFNPAVKPETQGGFTKSTVEERKKAFEDFIDYCLSFDDTRIVNFIDVIDWMKNPVALGATDIVKNVTSKDGILKSTLNSDGSLLLTVSKASNVKVTLNNAHGRVISELHNGVIAGEKSFNIGSMNLAQGVYLIAVAGDVNFTTKVIAQ